MRAPLSWARCSALVLTAVAAPACKTASPGGPAPAVSSARIEVDSAGLVAALVQKHGQSSRDRAERGVRQVAAYWRGHAGDAATMPAFVEESFVADPKEPDALPRRFSAAAEHSYAHQREAA